MCKSAGPTLDGLLQLPDVTLQFLVAFEGRTQELEETVRRNTQDIRKLAEKNAAAV